MAPLRQWLAESWQLLLGPDALPKRWPLIVINSATRAGAVAWLQQHLLSPVPLTLAAFRFLQQDSPFEPDFTLSGNVKDHMHGIVSGRQCLKNFWMLVGAAVYVGDTLDALRSIYVLVDCVNA